MAAKKPSSYDSLMQYAGLATQWMVVMLLALYGGNWLDKKAHFQNPVFVWVLPLFFLVAMLIKLVRDLFKKP